MYKHSLWHDKKFLGLLFLGVISFFFAYIWPLAKIAFKNAKPPKENQKPSD